MPTILTVGQDETLLNTRAAIFRKMQADVVAANLGQAMHILEVDHFDLIVLCHTLSTSEMINISDLAHDRNPATRVLKIIATASPADSKTVDERMAGGAFVIAFTGTPVAVKLGTSTDRSQTGQFQGRPNQIGDPAAGLTRKLFTPTTAGASPYVQWFNGGAFALAPLGTFRTMQRNSVYGPGFATVDAALVKNTDIREGVNLQLRAEMFNLFNRTNLANPGAGTLSSSTFGRSTSTRNNASAPGIGPGEPFNIQFAGKVIF
jgi:CheY-like chemotaxis protein